MKLIVYLFTMAAIMIFVVACDAQALIKVNNEKTRLVITKKVKDLPEVRSFFKEARQSKPIILADKEPNSAFNNYWGVNVGISNFDMLRTNFHFFVDPKTLDIYYLDIYAEDMKLITLQQWRQWRTTSIWQKRHTYKAGKIVALID